jgi:spore germination protein YaaH
MHNLIESSQQKYFNNIYMILLVFSSYGADEKQKSEDKFENKFNMSYIYFGNSSLYTDRVDCTRNSLNEISPNYFNIDESGNLSLTPALDKKFIEDMHERGVRVVPFISNHWDRAAGLAALHNRKKLAADVADVINTYDLDGINVDIENVTEKEREMYTDFVRILRETLPDDKTIAVAVAANPNGFTTGWHGSYDYARLAKYSDYLMFMAYDEHYQNSKPGPVSSMSFSRKTIESALKEVPKEKIVLGIPFYGRIWKNDSDRLPFRYEVSCEIYEIFSPLPNIKFPVNLISSPIISFRILDLPLPFFPIMATLSPALT